MMHDNFSFLYISIIFVSLALAGCATSSVGYEKEQYGNDPVSSKEYCNANCAAFAKDGSCLRHTEGSARVCKDFRTPSDQVSNVPNERIRPLALELCQKLPKTDDLRLMVSSVGKGDSEVPTRNRIEFLNALEQQISHDCAPANVVNRPSLPGLLSGNNGTDLNLESLLQQIKSSAAADFLIVLNWRYDGSDFHLSLSAVNVLAASSGTVVVGSTTERPILSSGL